MKSKLVEEANRKGYSGQYLCDMVNRKGFRCHINTFRRAVEDGKDRTEHEEMIYSLARSILDDLPPVRHDRSDMAGRAHEQGLTLKDVWRYYTATRGKEYTYGAFTSAIRRRHSAFECEIYNEAEKCLAEMADKRQGG